jgi:hypothetical protein
MTIGSYGISNFTKSRGVDVAVTTAAQKIQEAAQVAMLQREKNSGGRSRLLIHTDSTKLAPSERERYLRFMIVHQLIDDKGTPDLSDDEWEFSSRGTYLPKGGYYSVSLSNQPEATIPTVSVILPGDTATTRCHYYEFKGSAGIRALIVDPKIGALAPRLIISGGSLPPGAPEPIRSDKSGKKNVGGLVIWRNASTSRITHPDQIDTNL